MARSGIQLAYPFEEKRLLKWKPPYIVQPKYDGERCRAIPIGEGRYMLLSSQENPIFSVPHIVEYLSSLGTDIELDGELYCHGMSFEQIHSIVSRTVNLHPDHGEVRFYVFDYISEEPQMVRSSYLPLIVPQKMNIPITRAPCYLRDSLEGIKRTYDLLLNEGYEGIIIRNAFAPYVRKRSTYMMKFKPKQKDTYLIIGWKEEIALDGTPKGRIGSIICSSQKGDEFAVGAGLDTHQKSLLWNIRDKITGCTATIHYQHLTNKKIPKGTFDIEIPELGIM